MKPFKPWIERSLKKLKNPFKIKERLNYLVKNYALPEKFIEKYQDKINWFYVSLYQKLSEPFIEKYKDKLDWNFVSCHQKLSEKFIEKYQDKVNWNSIAASQDISFEFLIKHIDKINNKDFIKLNKKLMSKLTETQKLIIEIL